jgi:protein-S-isoprenylcysteine O-methyltransferase Ste14
MIKSPDLRSPEASLTPLRADIIVVRAERLVAIMASAGKLNIFITVFSMIGPPAILSYILTHYQTGAWTYVGLAIFFPSLILSIIAHVELGRCFTVTAQAQELVTSGIYSKIRHPIYVFGFLLLLSLVICVREPRWLIVLALLVPMQLRRVRNEERALEAKFGDAYRAYKRKTWF